MGKGVTMGEEEKGAQQPMADQLAPEQDDQPAPEQDDQSVSEQPEGNDDGDKPGVKYSE
jgi:hypothetical protein